MAERITGCGEKGCHFPKGKCFFVLETEDKAKIFQMVKKNGLPDLNDGAKRWGYIMQELYNNLNESSCVIKDQVGNEMQKITPDKLRSDSSTKVNP